MSHCGDYLILTPIKGCKNNLLFFTKFGKDKEITGKFSLTPVVTEFEADYEVRDCPEPRFHSDFDKTLIRFFW